MRISLRLLRLEIGASTVNPTYVILLKLIVFLFVDYEGALYHGLTHVNGSFAASFLNAPRGSELGTNIGTSRQMFRDVIDPVPTLWAARTKRLTHE